MQGKNRALIYSFLSVAWIATAMAQEQDRKQLPKGLLLEVPSSPKAEAPYSLSPTIIFEETFDAAASDWMTSGGWAISASASGLSKRYNSARMAATNGVGNYSDNANAWLISPPIALPAISPASQLTLRFSEWFQIESGYDRGYMKISDDNGASWTILSARDGKSDGRQYQIDLTPYANRQVKLAFHFTADGSNNYPGWQVADIQIAHETADPLTATLKSLNSQNFPFIYMNVAVDTFGRGFPDLAKSNFTVYENEVLQTDYFDVVPPAKGAGVRLADIVFLMDNSGSMSEEITAVRNNMIAFVNKLSTSGVDFSLGLCRFGASANGGYPIIEDNGILTNDANYFKNTVWARNVISGGFEPGWDALYVSATNFNFRPGAQKIFILITDETVTGDGNRGQRSQQEAIQILRDRSVLTFALIDDADTYARQDYGTVAQATGGAYFNIYSSFDAILNAIGNLVANTYVVTYRSSNPSFDGQKRTVRVNVAYRSHADTTVGSYIPGAAPSIQRTASTIALHQQSWAEHTAFNIDAEIVDNVAPNVQQARLYYKRTTTPTYSSVVMTRQSGNVFRGVIPVSAVLTPGLDYYITATDGNSTSSDPTTNPTSQPYQLAILPNVAPAITHTPVKTLTPGAAITITANIVDNTNTLSSAKLFYRKTGQLLYQQVTMTLNGANNYKAEISATYATQDGVDYYIYAVDNFGVSSTQGTADKPHRIEPLYDLGFRPNPNGWSFSNNNTVWPYGWTPFIDPLDEVCFCLLPTRCFPTWELFREAFGREQVENQSNGNWMRIPSAEEKWKEIKQCWGGSCFGFAISSFLFFDTHLSLSAKFPRNTRLYDVPIQDASRKLVNLYWIYQFGQNQQAHMNSNWRKTPVTTLEEIKQMFLSSTRDDRILVFFNQGKGGGGHAVNPYRVGVGAEIDTIYIYDNNAPSVERRILIDKTANSWNYPNMSGWGGAQGLFLMDPVSNYLTHPTLPKELPPKERYISKESNAKNYLEIYNTFNCDITIKSPTGQSIGFSAGKSFSTFTEGMPIIPITGSVHPPIGYYLPSASYTVQLSNFADTTMHFAVFTDSTVFSVERRRTNSSESDKLAFENGGKAFSLVNHNSSTKTYDTQFIASGSGYERVFGINECEISSKDSMNIRLDGKNYLKITNIGKPKKYNLLVRLASTRADLIFEHKNIEMKGAAVHRIEPVWENIAKQPVTISIDNNMDGVWDEIRHVENQYKPQTPSTGGELSNKNVYFYPNPFNPDMEIGTIRYSLGRSGNVSIKIYDAANALVKTLIQDVPNEAGIERSARWDGRNERGEIVANGVYFYVIESSAGEKAIGKAAVLR